MVLGKLKLKCLALITIVTFGKRREKPASLKYGGGSMMPLECFVRGGTGARYKTEIAEKGSTDKKVAA